MKRINQDIKLSCLSPVNSCLYTDPLHSSSQTDMQLICPSWSTTTVLGQPSLAAHAWCYVKAASVWVQTATSWGNGTTCCAQSPHSQPPPLQQAASTTDLSAHRANQTASGWNGSGWSAVTARARERPSAAWASQRAAGAAVAAPSWNQEFSTKNETMWRDNVRIPPGLTYRSSCWGSDRWYKYKNAKSWKELVCTIWVNITWEFGATNHYY